MVRDASLAPQRHSRPRRDPCKEERKVWLSRRNSSTISSRDRPGSQKAIPMHRLNCFSGTLHALASLAVCWHVCLHGKTWLPSVLLKACYTLMYRSQILRKIIQFPVRFVEEFFNHSIHIRHHGLVRPELFLLEDGDITIRDSLGPVP